MQRLYNYQWSVSCLFVILLIFGLDGCTFSTATPSATQTQESFIYQVRIEDQKGNPVESADVQMQIRGMPLITRRSDSRGYALFDVPINARDQDATIVIMANDYKPFTLNVSLLQQQPPEPVRLLPALTQETAVNDQPSSSTQATDIAGSQQTIAVPSTASSETPPVDNISSDPEVLERLLLEANIRLSGGPTERVEEVRSYMQTDQGYQQLAQSILRLLAGRHLKDKLDLDVINGYYAKLLNKTTASILPDEYNNIDNLKRAMLLDWNEHYPNRRGDVFDAIVE
jgi:hypothetical protein